MAQIILLHKITNNKKVGQKIQQEKIYKAILFLKKKKKCDLKKNGGYYLITELRNYYIFTRNIPKKNIILLEYIINSENEFNR